MEKKIYYPVYKSVSWKINKEKYCLKCINDPDDTRGFYSATSQLYMSLIRLLRNGVTAIDVDMSDSYRIYKENSTRDLYKVVFKKNESILNTSKNTRLLRKLLLYEGYFHHDHYRDFDYSTLNIVTRAFFSPSEQVKKKEQEIINKYKINPAKTVAVYYRGTDKGIEVKLASPEVFIELARKLLKKNPGFKVLIQTDQSQVANMFADAFKDRCIFLEELPTVSGVVAFHHSAIQNIGKQQHVITLDAVVRILSRCRYVINCTGNVAVFIALYRGNTKNLFQFDMNGELIVPDNWHKIIGLIGRNIHKRSPGLFRLLKPYFPDKK